MRIISFYTDKDYEKCIQKLKKSADKFGYEINVGYFPNADTWQIAIQKKVEFILQQYEFGNGILLYLDADTTILSKLETLKEFICEHDISVRKRDLDDKYNCGVMGFGLNRKKIIPFLQEWNNITQRKGLKYQTVDQRPFEQALQKYKKIKVGNLPAIYNFLNSDMLHNYTMTDAIIHHYKFSKNGEKARKWRKFLIWRRQNENE